MRVARRRVARGGGERAHAWTRWPQPLSPASALFTRWHAWEQSGLRNGVAIIAVAAAMVACVANDADDTRAAGDSVAAVAPAPADTSAPVGQGALPVDACPMVGLWKQCSLEKRLEQAGLVPVLLPAGDNEPVTEVPALVYRLGGAELHVWLFPDSSARAKEQGRLDPETSQPLGSLRRWPRPAETIASNNLLAVLLGENERATERIRLSLRAGLPPR